MKLNVKERIVLSNILPMSTGSLTTLREVQKLQTNLPVGELEKKALGLVEHDGRVTWDQTKDEPVEFEISLDVLHTIVRCFEVLDKQNLLTLDHLPIYESFMALAQNKAPEPASDRKPASRSVRRAIERKEKGL